MFMSVTMGGEEKIVGNVTTIHQLANVKSVNSCNMSNNYIEHMLFECFSYLKFPLFQVRQR